MEFYRLTKKGPFLDTFLKGEIWAGSLHYYRILERATQDAWTGDLYDGMQVNETGLLDPKDPRTRAIIQTQGVPIAGDGPIGGILFASSKNGFAFCFCGGELAKIWSENHQLFEADAAVQILDPYELKDVIEKHGMVGAQKVSSLYKVSIGQISYDAEPICNPIERGSVKASDAFSKRKKYAAQQEWRIFLEIPEPLFRKELPDGVLISIPSDRAKALFAEVPCPPVIPKSAASPKPAVGITITNFDEAKTLLLQYSRAKQDIRKEYRDVPDGGWHAPAVFREAMLRQDELAAHYVQAFLTFYWSQRGRYKDGLIESTFGGPVGPATYDMTPFEHWVNAHGNPDRAYHDAMATIFFDR